MNLPEAYLDFLRSGNALPITDYDGNAAQLLPLPESALQLAHAWATLEGMPGEDDDPHQSEGLYRVPFVDLMRCEELVAGGFGTICWLPEEQLFGAYDIEHHWFYLFTETTWEEIQADTDAFISILEGEPNPKTLPLIPWPKYPWFPWEDVEAMREAKS